MSHSPSAVAAVTASASKVAVARIWPGVRTSTTTSETGPSVCVCRMKRPTSLSDVASSEASTAASPTSRFTGAGKSWRCRMASIEAPSVTTRPRTSSPST